MSSTASGTAPYYFVPHPSRHPIMAAIGLFLMIIGGTLWINSIATGEWILLAGLVCWLFTLSRWFHDTIGESESGLYSRKIDVSYRWSMSWFIFSEVMFFLAFFGALFYARMVSVPWLDGASNNAMTAEILWPNFEAAWPLLKTPGGTETQAMPWSGLPLWNTLILLASSVTLQVAHVAIEQGNRLRLKVFLAITVLLGVSFLFLQGYEYMHAYDDLGLRLDSGVYGNTFYLLTGFHGLHVTIGALILLVMLLRIVIKDHFTAEHHFGFQAAAWYWHFVDVVWLNLFIFVYVL